MSASVLSVPRFRAFDSTGAPLSSGKVFTYAAGTTSLLPSYTDSTAASKNPNPVILDANGEASLWLASVPYKVELQNSAGVVQWTMDNVQPESVLAGPEWELMSDTPTYVDSNTFTVPGDRTITFPVGRRVRSTLTGTVVDGTIAAVAYTTLTTITVTWDNTGINNTISAVSLGILATVGADSALQASNSAASASTSELNAAGSATAATTSATASSTSATEAAASASSIDIGATLQNNFTKTQTWNKGADIASAATLALSADGNLADVTGAVTTTDFTVPSGTPTTAFGPWFFTPTGAWAITHTVGQVEIIGGASLTLAAGDMVMVWQDGAVFRVAQLSNNIISVKRYGAVGDGVTDDSVAVQAAIDAAAAKNGGVVFFEQGSYLCNTQLTVNSNGIILRGASSDSTSIKSTTTDGSLLKITGKRNSIENLLIYRNTFSTAPTSILVNFSNAIQCKIDNCWIQGGYTSLLITGTNTTDCIITRNTFTFATGSALILIHSSSGTNGGHRIENNLLNQGYPVSTPIASNYKGARADSTAYAVGDIYSSSGYYYQCKTLGTSGVGVPTPSFYGIDIQDGTAVFLLMGSTGYRGLLLGSLTKYIHVNKCDITGPYSTALRIDNDLSSGIPKNIYITDCTLHGPIGSGIVINKGAEIVLTRCNSFSPTGGGTTYGLMALGTDSIIITECQVFNYTNGIYLGSSRSQVVNNVSVGNTTGITVAANINEFSIIGNNVSNIGNWGSNTNAITVLTGSSDFYSISNNIIAQATNGVADNGTGTNKFVGQNF